MEIPTGGGGQHTFMVIPAKAGIHLSAGAGARDSGFRRNGLFASGPGALHDHFM